MDTFTLIWWTHFEMLERKHMHSVFDMMNEHLKIWKQAKEFDYYPDIDAAMGCQLSIVLTQHPVLYSGNAMEGCP
eukprot:616166-Ditylum_brightwellii.AAC.1